MKGRTLPLIIGIFPVLMVALIFASKGIGYSEQVSISESNFEIEDEVLANKTFELSFPEKLNENQLENLIYVVDENGEKADVTLDYRAEDHTVFVKSPLTGYELNKSYILTIHPTINLFAGEEPEEKVEKKFSIINQLPTIESKEQLQAIFEKASVSNGRHSSFLMFGDLSGMRAEQSESSSASSGSASSSAKGSMSNDSANFLETNVQVNGVDEGDSVKNDGTHIYSIDQRTKEITITKVNPAEDMAVAAKIEMEKQFQPQQLYLHNDRLVVIGQSYNQPVFYKNKQSGNSLPVDRPYQASVVKAIVYDVVEKENPTFVREFELEGSMTDTRMIDGNLYLVANSQPQLSYGDLENIDLRPFYRDTTVSDDVNSVPYSEIQYIPGDPKANYTIVASFDVEAEKEPEITTYLGGSRQVYMSKESLYVAITNNSFEPTGEHEQQTDILKFAINDGKVEYGAHTTVSGWLINQFAMDERNGYFRVATTKGFAGNNRTQSENQLYVLDSSLEKVGEVNNIAPGEQIYSVRFMDDRAYVVTFKTVDPLFVIDLKEPENPEILGELKIPGFSTYLHPYDKNHVIGFGVNTVEKQDPYGNAPRVVRDGMKISLFDIRDVKKPKEKFTEIIEGAGTYSELINNHKALMYHGQKGLFAFPITIHDKKFVFQGAHVYGVDLENGFDLKTKITHQKENSRYPNWEDAISRILYIDNQLYTLSPSKIMAHDIENFNFINEVELK